MANVATPSRPPTAKTAKRGDVEYIKENSDYLRHPLMQVGAVQLASCALAPAGTAGRREDLTDGSCHSQLITSLFLPVAVPRDMRFD